jgi:dienelactone hydrolase
VSGAEHEVALDLGPVVLRATIGVPAAAAWGVVVFAHGSGSGRHSSRNRQVAAALRSDGLVTVLADLLTEDEERVDRVTAQLRFDIGLLARRVIGLVDWAERDAEVGGLPVGLFGASTGAAAALVAAAERPAAVRAVVSRGGRPDLADAALAEVRAPTLLIVGGDDAPVVALNEEARARMRHAVRLEIVPGATHLFEEPGALERVTVLASDWFRQHLRPGRPG